MNKRTNITLDDFKNLFKSQRESYEELFSTRQTENSNFSISNNYQTNNHMKQWILI
ncbi:MAG: hypothetical protein ACNI3C_09520 [Candidatus Marinarcus sp.]|uniref:hypothetical protein n=1 Tax=Candidatus Marinarcus sp. TaxID=3100987 RepID=UPI003B008737